jgi:tryptophanyl-tRNA synthetase
MSAVTDNCANVHFDPENQPGISNLMQILSSLSDERPMGEIESEFAGKGYGEFKRSVADAVCAKLEEIQTRYNEVLSSGEIDRALNSGAERANLIADEKLAKVQKALGMEIIR